MNSLKIKKTIFCETCGCKIIKTKTIKVKSTTSDEAIIEAKKMSDKWSNSIKPQNCKICDSILKEVNK